MSNIVTSIHKSTRKNHVNLSDVNEKCEREEALYEEAVSRISYLQSLIESEEQKIFEYMRRIKNINRVNVCF